MKRKYLIILLFIILIISFIYFINVTNGQLNQSRDIISNENNKPRLLAVMINNDNGIGYDEYQKNTLPDETYKFKESKCVDTSGLEVKNILTYDEKTKTISIKTNKSVRCTLYFERSIISYLRNQDMRESLSKDLIADMYRYQGVALESSVDESHKLVDNNYICFGTHNIEECLENEDKFMYRIIGITNDEKLKLIKKTRLKERNIKSFTYSYKSSLFSNNGDYYCSNGGCPEWNEIVLYKRLNGISNGTIYGSGSINDKADSDIFIDSEDYDYLKSGDGINGTSNASEWFNLIENYNWFYGILSGGLSVNVNGETVYGARNNGLIIWQVETGQLPTYNCGLETDTCNKLVYKWGKEQSVQTKIGLMYVHEYYLAYDNTTSFNTDPNTNNWIFIDNNDVDLPHYEWLITGAGHYGNGSYGAYFTNNNGQMTTRGRNISYAIRPTFYLNNKITLRGNGTKINPFIIL